jgi:spermidine synthase
MPHTGNATGSQQRAGRSVSAWALVIFTLFFLSGMTSLIYEVIWVRKFGLVFGITTYAVSTVLAAFFAGLAVGSFVAGRIIDRTRLHPLIIYGGIEGVIGLYALLLPLFLKGVEASYPFVYATAGESFALFTLFRFVVSFVLLAIPTTLMGATLPVLSKLMVDREEVLGLSVGRLYAVNTFGAVVGTFSAGFLFIPTVGVATTTLLAAMGNFLLALVALLISTSPDLAVRPAKAPEAPEAAPAPLGSTAKAILALSFTSGLAIIALEVVWTRSLVLVLGSTTYAFSTMLTAVLVGIALGSAVFAPLADRSGNRAAWVAGLLFVGGGFAVLGPAILNRLPFVFLRLYEWAYGVWGLVIAVQFAVCFLLVFVPTFLSGASFPILVRMYSRGEDSVGRTVADVYAINTLGGILGSLVAGFVLVKYVGLQPSLTVAALTLMLVGGMLALAIARPWTARRRGIGAAVVLVAVIALTFYHPRFDTKLLFAGWGPYAGGYYVSRLGGYTVDVTDRHTQRLLYHKEGVTASVDVMETAWGDRMISVNAKPVATTYVYDMRALKMLGHLPALLHPDPKDALIIGLGAGVSIGIIASYPSVEHVTTVELCEEVPGGAAHFAEWNHSVLDNDKLELVINDGANYVKATRKQYDLISCDPIHPFVAGAGTLYSREHWEKSKERLREGGILAQWLPLYHLSPYDFATIVGTFVDVFPNATLWFCGIDTVLIGAKGDLKIDLERMGVHMSSPTVMADLLSMGVHSPADVLGWYVAGPDELRDMGMGAPRNHTDFPILEFSAPKSVMLAGVASTMPALLTAVQQTSAGEVRRQMNSMSVRPLDAQTLLTAATARLAGRWLMRSQLLISYDHAQESLDAALEALGLRPNDTFLRRAVGDAQYIMGEQSLIGGDLEMAYEFFREAYLNDGENLMALTSAVRAALKIGDPILAEDMMSRASDEQRRAYQYLVSEGVLALGRLNYEAARQAFEEAAGHGQESPPLHARLGLLDLRQGHRDSAHEHFRRSLEIATYRFEALQDIVELCVAAERGSEVRPYAEELAALASAAIANNPGEPELYATRAMAYSVLGEDGLAARDRATQRSLLGWWAEPSPPSYPGTIFEQ